MIVSNMCSPKIEKTTCASTGVSINRRKKRRGTNYIWPKQNGTSTLATRQKRWIATVEPPTNNHYKNTLIQIYWKFHLKNKNVQIKKSDIFHISAQNIDCWYLLEPPQRSGSNEYPQSLFWTEIRKIMYIPSLSQFYYIRIGFKGIKII